VPAFAEHGKAPTIPALLIRVPEGTRRRTPVTVRANHFGDSALESLR
jgi:hypothetical protein